MEKPDYYAHLALIYDYFGRETVFVPLNRVAKFLHKEVDVRMMGARYKAVRTAPGNEKRPLSAGEPIRGRTV